jgi:hypothetical protein
LAFPNDHVGLARYVGCFSERQPHGQKGNASYGKYNRECGDHQIFDMNENLDHVG